MAKTSENSHTLPTETKIHTLLIKCAVTTHGKPYSLLSETALTTFMETHPLLTKCAVIKH